MFPLLKKEGRSSGEYSRKYDYPVTDRYYTSPLIRTKQTFEILYPGRHLDGILPGFIEMSFGDTEGLPESFAGSLTEYYARWSRGEKLWNGESIYDMKERMAESVRDLLEKMRTEGLKSVTVVTHSCAIKTILMNCRYMSDEYTSVFVHPGMGYRLTFGYDGETVTPVKMEYVPVEMEWQPT